ncbi:MAG TPA: phenylalanine--tRNA ligase subunit beta [Anaerolineae bacterium]|nr:phenylalanine--tRNA ligase subunit beta [Anaerolineae bacterium]
MKVPLRWLRDYVDITISLEELSERLTLAGLEVEAVERIGDWWDRSKIVVGEVTEVRPHPDADRLVLVDVRHREGPADQCVTGAPNLFEYKGLGKVSLKVAYAMEGAELYDGHQEGFVKTRLKRTKIRGVPSSSMVCSEKELGISEAHEGILLLPDDAPVGMPLADYLGDTILDISLTPNLARCMSVIGVAREVTALTGAPLRYPSLEWRTEGGPAGQLASVQIEDPDLCSRYVATIVQNVEIGPGPKWMQERLSRAGMRPISDVVDVTNYVMLEWGQPLHAFDYDKLVARAGGGAPTIIVRRAKPGETMRTLDGEVRTFTHDALLICDTAGPIAIAGVMGGMETEVDEGTRSILLESANFDMISIRRTTQALRLPSEASLRFGRGIHPAMAERAARRASEMMRVLAGGRIAQGMVDAYPRPARPITIELPTAQVERTLGIAMSTDEVVRSLQSLEFGCEATGVEGAAVVRVTVPDHRIDCTLPADLIEEVARIYGYDRIPETMMADRLPPQRGNRDLELEEAVRDTLVVSGLQEVITYTLTTVAREAALQDHDPLGSADQESRYLKVTNPITQERTAFRQRLLTTMLEVVSENLRFRDRVALFELGRVFLPRPGEQLPNEVRRLCIVLSGPREERHWLTEGGADVDYFDLKGVVEALLARLHTGRAEYRPADESGYQRGRTAHLWLGETCCGILGELSAGVRQRFELPARRIAAAEIDLEALLALVPTGWFVEPISPYPAVLQDLAIIVDEDVPAATVQSAVESAGGPLLRQVRAFDVYRGAQVPVGKKSLAFGLTFQSPGKTLSDELVSKQVTRILARLRKELGAEVRGM